MEIPINSELIIICKEISAENKSIDQWSEIESGDMFQSGCLIGGFDADDKEFCFSFFGEDKSEYWFQLGLSIANKIASGHRPILKGVKVMKDI